MLAHPFSNLLTMLFRWHILKFIDYLLCYKCPCQLLGSGASTLTGRQTWILRRLKFLEPHTRRMASVSNLSSQVTELCNFIRFVASCL